MRQVLRDIDPSLPFNKFRTIDDLRGEAVTVSRIEAALLGALAAIALLLCAIGVYGLVAHSVADRRREFGVRMALGGNASEILKAAIAPGVALAFSGAAVGLALAAAFAQVMQQLVFGLSVRDPLTLTFAAAIVMSTALIAATVPAVRVLRMNVMTVMNGR
jgi:ABC-type antimicrobial peptide transport system permease subunit